MQWEWFVRCEEQDRSLFQLRTSRTESRVNGQDNYGVGDDLSDQVAARSFIRSNRFSLCCFVDGLQLSEDHFHHLPNAHSAKTDDSTSVQFETFSHPENFLGHLTCSVAGSEWRCKISISKSSFYVQSGLWSTLVQFKFVLIFCKWGRSFWSKRILNHKWTACLILVSVSLLGADSLYTSAAECIYNWRGCYQIS